MVQLAALIVIAVAAFFVTRTVAAENRRVASHDAEVWFRRGTAAMSAGRLDDAASAFRLAATRRRGERSYVLALARALAAKGDAAAARQQLLALRDNAPEDPVVNLELARLAASHDGAQEARRFYYNALYAPWAPEQSDERRRIRIELIRLLIAQGDSARALSELLAVSLDLPKDQAHQIEVAKLFADVGDYRRALAHFQEALAQSPDDPTALAGAGMAAFRLADYSAARRYLQRAGGSRAVKDTLETATLVLNADPLGPRLGAEERRRRIEAAIGRANDRLAMCTTPQPDVAAESVSALRNELAAWELRLKRRGSLDQDTAEDALALAARVEQYVGQRCAPPAPIDRALVLISLKHGSTTQ